jgi:hypothetical protein
MHEKTDEWDKMYIENPPFFERKCTGYAIVGAQECRPFPSNDRFFALMKVGKQCAYRYKSWNLLKINEKVAGRQAFH